ncbi:MAG: class I SAM-dependent methyltransferase [Deltaproteobacteria bacterium]
MTRRFPVQLQGVPETMLWTLHNRASEAKRKQPILVDPHAVKVYEAIDYDYERSFGKADATHALRSRAFDRAVQPWLASHPGGTVVELAAGLETQFFRCDDGLVKWVCVDMPEAIDVRERFLPATDRCRHLRMSALDVSWFDEIDPARGVFVTAQGLFMYLNEPDVRSLFGAILERFGGVELMFDTIPRWYSKQTLAGWGKTPSYRAPRMPWGINRPEIERTLRSWSPRVRSVALQSFGAPTGPGGIGTFTLCWLPVLRNLLPTIVRVR